MSVYLVSSGDTTHNAQNYGKPHLYLTLSLAVTATQFCHAVWCDETTLYLKKVPTFKLSVTLSNLNRFSKLLHCWKAYEICYKTRTTIFTSPNACWYATLGY